MLKAIKRIIQRKENYLILIMKIMKIRKILVKIKIKKIIKKMKIMKPIKNNKYFQKFLN